MNITLSNPLQVLALQKLYNNKQEIQNFHDRVRSEMTTKAIEGSIIKTKLKKLRLHQK